ncbi:cytochrome d ubiquinol oxidase subunit III [Salmonella enterica subsp. enterica]|uniref:Z-ring associated protein G n=1 Tax=Salmonella enterica I TaxID=59201 RepID=A0A447TUC2_SALET|nr:cytochrome d ubiquinol oxidase subunit III [Salmonella enterica subsp. enterica]
MTWEYALIGLVVGIIIGAVAMRFGNRKLRQQQALQYELEKNKAELEEYREELVKPLCPQRGNCWIPWRMITASCISIWRKAPAACCRKCLRESNPFRNRLAESEASNDQAPVQMPRDYSEGASGLLRSGAKRD